MEEMLEDLERDAKKQAKEDKPEEKEVLIPELEKKDVPNEDKNEQK